MSRCEKCYKLKSRENWIVRMVWCVGFLNNVVISSQIISHTVFAMNGARSLNQRGFKGRSNPQVFSFILAGLSYAGIYAKVSKLTALTSMMNVEGVPPKQVQQS